LGFRLDPKPKFLNGGNGWNGWENYSPQGHKVPQYRKINAKHILYNYLVAKVRLIQN
jgi:hypothetical protein